MTFQFNNPEFLWLLVLLPIWVLLKGRSGRSAAVIFSSVAIASEASKKNKVRAGQALILFRLLSVALFIIALARPQLGKGYSEVETSGIDIVLALDLSGSMHAHDFELKKERVSRMTVSKKVISEFINERPNDRIGLIAFAQEPFLVSPLTLNHSWLEKNLDRLEIGLIDQTSTAIGSAIAMSTNRLRDLNAKSKVIILLTDGENNSGKVSPVAAAEAAASYNVKIYTIAVGTEGFVPIPVTLNNGEIARDRLGRPIFQQVQVNVDDETLMEVAEVTNGKFFKATNTDTLRQVYQAIDELEKTEVKLRHFDQKEELFLWPTLVGMLLLGLEQILGQSRYKRLP